MLLKGSINKYNIYKRADLRASFISHNLRHGHNQDERAAMRDSDLALTTMNPREAAWRRFSLRSRRLGGSGPDTDLAISLLSHRWPSILYLGRLSPHPSTSSSPRHTCLRHGLGRAGRGCKEGGREGDRGPGELQNGRDECGWVWEARVRARRCISV